MYSEGEKREVESEGDGESRKFSGKGNGGRDRRKVAQRKTQEAVVGQCFLMQGR